MKNNTTSPMAAATPTVSQASPTVSAVSPPSNSSSGSPMRHRPHRPHHQVPYARAEGDQWRERRSSIVSALSDSDWTVASAGSASSQRSLVPETFSETGGSNSEWSNLDEFPRSTASPSISREESPAESVELPRVPHSYPHELLPELTAAHALYAVRSASSVISNVYDSASGVSTRPSTPGHCCARMEQQLKTVVDAVERMASVQEAMQREQAGATQRLSSVVSALGGLAQTVSRLENARRSDTHGIISEPRPSSSTLTLGSPTRTAGATIDPNGARAVLPDLPTPSIFPEYDSNIRQTRQSIDDMQRALLTIEQKLNFIATWTEDNTVNVPLAVIASDIEELKNNMAIKTAMNQRRSPPPEWLNRSPPPPQWLNRARPDIRATTPTQQSYWSAPPDPPNDDAEEPLFLANVSNARFV